MPVTTKFNEVVPFIANPLSRISGLTCSLRGGDLSPLSLLCLYCYVGGLGLLQFIAVNRRNSGLLFSYTE